MRNFLTTLIQEKGAQTDDSMNIEGHIGLTYENLIEFVSQEGMSQHHAAITNTLVKIDFKNGDVFHFLNHLALGMIAAMEA